MYKYHKRTKEGRTGKADGKTYRFFDQLEAFEHHPQIQSPTPPKPPTPTTTLAMPLPNLPSIAQQVTVTSATLHTVNVSQGLANIVTQPVINATTIPSFPPTNPTNTIFPPHNHGTNLRRSTSRVDGLVKDNLILLTSFSCMTLPLLSSF